MLSLSIPLCGRLIGCYEPNEGKALKPPRIAEKTDQTLKKPLYLQILSCVLCAIVPRARAHHSFAADYDASKPVTLRGTVTRFEWMNPHAHLYLDVKRDSGEITNWEFELGTPNMLLTAGWRELSRQIAADFRVPGKT
jgi:hypothetical protein